MPAVRIQVRKWNLTSKSYVADGSLIKIQALLGIRPTVNVPSSKMAPEGLTIFDALKRIQEMQEILNRFDQRTLDLTDHTKQVIALTDHNSRISALTYIVSAGIAIAICYILWRNCGRQKNPTIIMSAPTANVTSPMRIVTTAAL